MKFGNFLIGFILSLILVLNSFAYARGSGSRSSSSHSSYKVKASKSSKPSSSTVRVKSYRKKNGRAVAAHRRTKADTTKVNNFSTVGNTNPYTGKKGTKSP